MTSTALVYSDDTYPKKRSVWEPLPEYETKDWRMKTLRVAAYIRVSTDSDDQLNSFENQRSYYEDFVKRYPNWEYVGIYADEGISGTSTKQRVGFQNMLKDCEAGKIDLVVVKEVSRFARNTLDCLQATRELLRLNPPVGVFFDSNGINTLDVGSEFFLAVFAMFAQMESELKSSSVKFGLAENYRKGKYLCPTNNLLGYNKVQKYGMDIEPKGAKAVQLIYKLFLSGVSLTQIAETMMLLQVPTGGEKFKWDASNITSILRNERYCGDIVTQKEYVEDIFTRRKVKNMGMKKMMYEQGHHDAIVSRDEHVRALLLLKANRRSPYFNLHYEIKVIHRGLLSGFIPLNITFGGYEAEHYLGAVVNANTQEIVFEEHLPISKSITAEIFGSNDNECLTISRTSITFNASSVKYLDSSHVELLLNPQERLIAVRKTAQTNPNALALTNKDMSSMISRVIYDLMGWRCDIKHRIIADIFEKDGHSVMFFNLSNSEYCIKSKRLLSREWLNVFDEPPGKRMLSTRLLLARKLDDWLIGAEAESVDGFNTDVPETSEAVLDKHIQELKNEYIGWQPENYATSYR